MENVTAPTFYDGTVMIRKFMNHEDKFVLEIANKKEDTVDTNLFETEDELNFAIAEWRASYKFKE